MAARGRSRRKEPSEAAAPFELLHGKERCRERFLHVRRPMFDRVFVRDGCVVALPRRGTTTASPVAFELASGREIELATLTAAEASENGDRVRLDYLRSPVGRGPSQVRLFAGGTSEPWRTLELPDAISGVAEAPFGWYVGCRDGFLYGVEKSGDLAWRWQTPGAAGFRPSSPAEVYFRPSPYRLASNGRSALVAWWGSLWSVGPDGTTEWGLRLQDLIPPHVNQIRLRARPSRAADALEVPAHASLQQIKRAYREAVMQTHPDLHPEDPTATTRFRRVQEAYESLTGQTTRTGNGAASGVIRFVVPAFAHVSFLAVVEDDWLVGSGGGRLFRLSSRGQQLARLRVGLGALFCVRDSAQQVVAVCSYPVAGRSPPKLWFVDAPAPVRLPEQYPWPDHVLGSYGTYLLAHRPRARDLALIDETGALAMQLRCPRAITSIGVAEGVLVLAAGALICLEIEGLSPLTRTRIWQPPFTGAATHQPKVPQAPEKR